MSYYVYHIQCQSAVLYQIYQPLLLVKIKPIVALVKESGRVDSSRGSKGRPSNSAMQSLLERIPTRIPYWGYLMTSSHAMLHHSLHQKSN